MTSSSTPQLHLPRLPADHKIIRTKPIRPPGDVVQKCVPGIVQEQDTAGAVRGAATSDVRHRPPQPGSLPDCDQ
jgi:hypothetical protein